MLKDLLTRNTTVNSTNVDQVSFIINLMHRYNDWDLNKGKSHRIFLARANDVFLDAKKSPKKEIKSFLPKKSKSIHFKRTKNEKELY